jgi:hypothetical protein
VTKNKFSTIEELIMNIFKTITIASLLSIPIISLADGGYLWEQNIQERQAEKSLPIMAEGAATKWVIQPLSINVLF